LNRVFKRLPGGSIDYFAVRTSMFQTDLLKNKRCLITGGGTGIGKAMAQRFLELGAIVYICGRREQVLRQTQKELADQTGGQIHIFTCDVRYHDEVEAMVEKIWKEGALDVLVNNAAGNFIARTEDLSPHAFEAVIGIVLTGTINLTMSCGRRWLREGHKATILNITTTYAATGSPFVVPSAVAKAGVVALTRSLAVEWGPRGIRSNAIAPGPIPTQGAFSRLMPIPELEERARQRIPLRRFGTTEECANLAAYLISDGSAYINGDVITMDGGEWLAGAAEFTQVGEVLSDADWQALRNPKKKT